MRDYNAESLKQGSKRFNSQGRRNIFFNLAIQFIYVLYSQKIFISKQILIPGELVVKSFTKIPFVCLKLKAFNAEIVL